MKPPKSAAFAQADHYVIPSDVVVRVKMISQGLIALFSLKNGIDYNRRLLINLNIVLEEITDLIQLLTESENNET